MSRLFIGKIVWRVDFISLKKLDKKILKLYKMLNLSSIFVGIIKLYIN